jgi:hypothetical protein
MPRLASVSPPDHGIAEPPPEVSPACYRARHAAARQRMHAAGLDWLVVYGDREHSANLAYLTGFDPRFEEALLLVAADGRMRLLVGNECLGYLPDAALGIEIELFQELSLPGQARDASRPLDQLLADVGIGPGHRVGCVGWKVFDGALIAGGALASELPAYLIDALRARCGAIDAVRNATGLFIDPADGLRLRCEPEQIVRFEYAAGITSAGVRAVVAALRPGVREDMLERMLDARGLPLSCHRMLSVGAKARRGLASPGAGRAQLGDSFTCAFGVSGALTCRAGAIAAGPADLPAGLAEFYPSFAANYFAVTRAWYQALAVGVPARSVFHAADGLRDPALFDFAVNPGHALHLDEWVHSAFTATSDVTLASGMVLQMDIIPVSRGPFCTANAEDGVVLADAALRAALAATAPACWERMQARRAWMQQALGITLHESVLPLADTTGWFAPYALAPDQALVW